mmetsp:Transcript_50206/g.98419  ORF Transcript_50206/g.98419 Transcript_50206/m.98419 type:complete len:189 (-) Transcript_50206:289-855(-)
MLGKLPILTLGDNELSITGTSSILRYLGREHKMEGDNEEQIATMDLMYQACDEFMAGYDQHVNVLRDNFSETRLQKFLVEYLQFFEKALHRAQTLWSGGYGGFVAGPTMSAVDIYMFDCICYILGVSPRQLDQLPVVRDWFVSVGTRDNLNEYMVGPSRPTYASSPKAAFGNEHFRQDPAENPFRILM